MLRILAAFVLLVAFAAEMRAAGEVGSQAPDFEFLSTWNIPGGQTRLSSFRGSVVLVESFATW
jgi:hypothetical protein